MEDCTPIEHTDRGGLTLPDHKRLEVAKALATEVRLLLLDEVMAAGSSRLRLETRIKRSEE
jgi:ABC-type branched-subunit amino acid transport system ATPase component